MKAATYVCVCVFFFKSKIRTDTVAPSAVWKLLLSRNQTIYIYFSEVLAEMLGFPHDGMKDKKGTVSKV